MCTNFIPTAADMLAQFGVELAPFDYKEEAYPGQDAQIMARIVRGGRQTRTCACAVRVDSAKSKW